MTVTIDVVSDVVCPWCLIGKRRLASALALWRERAPDAPDVAVAWHPFQLNPQLPAEGIERSAYVAAKFGGRAKEIYQRVGDVGRSVGIDFAFDRIARQPNTVAAHQLIGLAGELGRQDAMVEALFRGYFLDGVDLTVTDNLVALAQRAGVDAELARSALRDDARRRAVQAADEQARGLGISGVPFFIFNQRLSVSGAQTPEVLLNALTEAATEHSLT